MPRSPRPQSHGGGTTGANGLGFHELGSNDLGSDDLGSNPRDPVTWTLGNRFGSPCDPQFLDRIAS